MRPGTMTVKGIRCWGPCYPSDEVDEEEEEEIQDQDDNIQKNDT
jgi:hypothetical protein